MSFLYLDFKLVFTTSIFSTREVINFIARVLTASYGNFNNVFLYNFSLFLSKRIRYFKELIEKRSKFQLTFVV